MSDHTADFLLTVVICTYNRKGLLNICLNSLVAQTAPKDDFEVIVVDNNSTDGTVDAASAFASDFPHYRIITEPAQGLSHARNRGWREACGEYVAYIDDDAKAEADWCARIMEATSHGRYDMFGGPYHAYFIEEAPAWFRKEYGESFLPGSVERELLPSEYLSGTNMVIRKEVLSDLGGFDPDMGMKGATTAYGEETLFQKRMRERDGYRIMYIPALKVRHLVSSHKMSIWWQIGDAFESHRSWMLVCRGKVRYSLRGFLRFGVWMMKEMALLPFRDRKKYPYWQNYVYENRMRIFTVW